jgi:membrane protein DedA with SNARE-associated domain
VLADVTTWAAGVVESLGYVGVTMLVLLETVFPPIAGMTLPLAGFVVGRGDASLPAMIAVASIGSLVGNWVLYGVSAAIGPDRVRVFLLRYGAWSGLTARHFDRAEAWFARRADAAVLLGRCIPIVRSLVSIPAGFQRMPFVRFSVLTFVGNLVWITAFVSAGAVLGDRWSRIDDVTGLIQAVSVIAWAIVVSVVLWRRVLRPRLDRSGQLPPDGPAARED